MYKRTSDEQAKAKDFVGNGVVDLHWETVFKNFCPDINQEELAYCKSNGGFRYSCRVLEQMKKSKHNPETILEMTSNSPLAALLFFAGYNVIYGQPLKARFYGPSASKLENKFSEIVGTNISVARSLLERAELIHNECGPDSFCLSDIAGINITFARLVLEDYSEVVKEHINQSVEKYKADTAVLCFEDFLGIFLPIVDKNLGYPENFMEDFMSSDLFKEKYTSQKVELID